MGPGVGGKAWGTDKTTAGKTGREANTFADVGGGQAMGPDKEGGREAGRAGPARSKDQKVQAQVLGMGAMSWLPGWLMLSC